MRGLRTPKSALWLLICAVATMLAVVACGAADPEVVRVVETVVVTEQVVKEVEVQKEVVKEVEVEVVREVEVVKEVEVVREIPAEAIIKEVVVVATPVPGGDQWKLAAISPDARRGGHFIKAAHGPPSIFDWYATGTIANTGSQGPMYDLLLRHDPRDPSVPIVPDLAHSWEISSDGSTYSFNLREGVLWHDGDEFTSEDVKATYERIVFPPEGLVSLRKTLFTALDSIETPDDYTVQFNLNETRSSDYMLQTFSVGYNMITKKETFEENNWDLSKVDNHPGTGPFIYSSRDTEKWIQERNVDYWNENVPYVDKMTHVWLIAWTPELAAALLGGVVDWAQWLDPDTFERVKTIEGMSTLELIVPSIAGITFNTERAPFNDVRVRQAFNLVVDKPKLAEAIDSVTATFVSGWYMPGTPYAWSTEKLLTIPGHRSPTAEDIAKAKQLLAEAGYPDGQGIPELHFAVRETPNNRIGSAAVQAMVKEHLNVDTDINIHQASAIAQVAQSGDFDLITGGYGSRVLDPYTYIVPAFGQCGDELCDQNTSRYRNPEFDRLGAEFIKELDQKKRFELANQIREILERDVPVITIGSTSVQWGWYDYLNGVTPGNMSGGYDVYKWDHVWLGADTPNR